MPALLIKLMVRSIAALLCGLAASACAQTAMFARTLTETVEQHGSSGTSIEPPSTPIPMLMTQFKQFGVWQFMLHANAFAVNTQQQSDSPRNRDAFFSTGWIMPMARRTFGDHGELGQLTLRAMFSFEPATVPHRNYPELFQQGETAYGAPIVDGQHPHDFFMELAALYDLKLSHNTLLSLYAAPVGDPAIGPTAYPHRLSASEDPIAALGHHQEDSTHIAFNVLTGGLTWRWARIELSGFHGAEPTEAHWRFEPSPNGHAIDSVSTRLTVSPAADWAGQYSFAHIHSPEALYPGEDQQRQTASVMFHHIFRSKPMHTSMPGMTMEMPEGKDADVTEPTTDLSATLLWGRTRSLADNSKENSYLAEMLLRFASKNYLWMRLENAGRSNELLLTPGESLPAGFVELPIGHVAAYTFGYDHDLPLGPHVLAAPGMQFTVYHAPAALQSTYGSVPVAEQFFVRLRLH